MSTTASPLTTLSETESPVPPGELPGSGLAAEVRESLLLLAFAVLVTVGLTALAQGVLASVG